MERVLLDTHSFIWFIEGNARLSQSARILIEEEVVAVVSIVGAWEEL